MERANFLVPFWVLIKFLAKEAEPREQFLRESYFGFWSPICFRTVWGLINFCFFYVFPRIFCKNVFSLKERAEKSRRAAYFASLGYQGVHIWGLEERSISKGGVSGDWLVEVNTEDEDNYRRWEEDGKFKYRSIYTFLRTFRSWLSSSIISQKFHKFHSVTEFRRIHIFVDFHIFKC